MESFPTPIYLNTKQIKIIYHYIPYNDKVDTENNKAAGFMGEASCLNYPITNSSLPTNLHQRNIIR